MKPSQRALQELRSNRYGASVTLRGSVDVGATQSLLEGPSPDTAEELEFYKLGNETWVFTWECDAPDSNLLVVPLAEVTMGAGGTQIRKMQFDLWPSGTVQLPSTFSRISVRYHTELFPGLPPTSFGPVTVRGILRRGFTSSRAKMLVSQTAPAAVTNPANIAIPAFADDFIVGIGGSIPANDATFNAGTTYFQVSPGGLGIAVHELAGPSMLTSKNNGLFIPVAAAASEIAVTVTAGVDPFQALYTFRIGM